ncbi:MAG: TCR/Tet family MFS transporter [Alphaproteobacteria bacterium]
MSARVSPDPDARPSRAGRHGATFIFITILLDVLGLGIIIPVLPDLIQGLTGEGLDRAAVYGGAMMFLYAVIQFFAAPIIGNLSDRFGRRPVLLISLMGLSIDYVIMALAPTIVWLFVGRALTGIGGATITTASAYMADVSSPEQKARNFGLLGAAFGLGFILGPLIGGLFSVYGPRAPFYAAAAVAFANFLYGLLVLPESLPAERRRPFDWSRANPVGALLDLRQYPMVLPLAGGLFLFHIGHYVYPSVWNFFTIAAFEWSAVQVGLSLTAVGVVSAFVQGGLVGPIVQRAGPMKAAIIGLSFAVIGHLGYALSATPFMLYAVMGLTCLSGISGPAINGLLSNAVPADSQGALQGGVTSLMSVAAIIGPPVMTLIFSTFTAPGAPVQFPGAPFILSASLMALALLTILVIGRRARVPLAGS